MKSKLPREAHDSPSARRRKAMLDAAYDLFVQKGFSSVTVDDVIRVSGGSKSSFYTFFGNKEGALKAVIEALADEFIQEIRLEAAESKSVAEQLRSIGHTVVRLALSENAINQYRLAVANATARPELSMLWYESGPKSTFDVFATVLEQMAKAGKLRIKDPRRAALIFMGMLIFKDNMTMSIGAPPPSQRELKEIVNEAVDVFLAAYGPAKP